ncbi:ADC synthase [Zopfia rhizophila CBS 207.26]|uniref:ADC synthase n=1 Tax=Zopfia rhizophila CBS 207.26 TaxID=1314779 RepID=A0A6A6EM09_9PEZI|nr:ADC synthase [Zopfia rhizophila CBS 207.26]
MRIDRLPHVQHLTSEVFGVLRPECTRWDTLLSIFPAGTVSGAPKVRAMELIYEMEQETRGIYAGATGCVAYTQAGGGIVCDSDKIEEWLEVMNKLAANLRCVELVERYLGDGKAKSIFI